MMVSTWARSTQRRFERPVGDLNIPPWHQDKSCHSGQAMRGNQSQGLYDGVAHGARYVASRVFGSSSRKYGSGLRKQTRPTPSDAVRRC